MLWFNNSDNLTGLCFMPCLPVDFQEGCEFPFLMNISFQPIFPLGCFLHVLQAWCFWVRHFWACSARASIMQQTTWSHDWLLYHVTLDYRSPPFTPVVSGNPAFRILSSPQVVEPAPAVISMGWSIFSPHFRVSVRLLRYCLPHPEGCNFRIVGP